MFVQVSDDIIYLPTLYPGDSIFSFKWASETAPSACLNKGERTHVIKAI